MINIDTIAPAVRAEVETRLAGIEASEGVRFLLAIESGSRAWGFPSPDSDYDIRFVYVREREWYLGLTPGRDVIEQPIVDEIDLNGWDIRKALNLLLKSNATLGEWMDSPIRYRPDDPVVARIKALADAVLNPRALGHHYRNVGINAAARWLAHERFTHEDAHPAVQASVDNAARPLARYRCAACGFEAQGYFWQCPGCQAWDSFPPRRIEEL